MARNVTCHGSKPAFGSLPERRLVRIFARSGVIAPPPAVTGGGVITARKGVNFQEWLNRVTEEVPVDEA